MTLTNETLTAVPGIRVGHQTDLTGVTGCTVVICPPGTVGGVDQQGGAPGTRETDLLRPLHRVDTVNAVVLSGGSAFGLATADGVMRYLAENGIGYHSSVGYVVPIVPAAILMDLAVGSGDARPDAAMGYAACQAATTNPVEQGNIGAGTGCRVGAILGNEFASKGGIGAAAVEIADGIIVAALVAVNAVGDVIDENGEIIAGVRQPPDGNTFVGMLNIMRQRARLEPPQTENTVIGVVATNAKLDKSQVNKVAQMAQAGLVRAVKPANTMYDGDTLFALATGELPADASVIGAFAAEVVAQAIRNGVRSATTLAGLRAGLP